MSGGDKLPPGQPFAIIDVNWSGFLGIVRTNSEITFTIKVAHAGPAQTTSLWVRLFDGAGNLAWEEPVLMHVFNDVDPVIATYEPQMTRFLAVPPGIYRITIQIVDVGTGSVILSQDNGKGLAVMA